MMKETKRRIEITSFYDHTGIETHLEKMAAKGWLLEKVSNFFWTYRRVEPTTAVKFAVTYFPSASDFDPKPSESQQTFVDYCAQSGWKLAGLSAQMQVFYNEEENPVPIETDPLLQVENIHKAMKRNFIPSSLILLACAVLQIALNVGQIISAPMYVFFNNFSIASIIPWTLVVILCSSEIITYLRWHKKAKAAALEDDLFLPTISTRRLQIIVLIVLAVFLVLWLLSLGGGSNLAIALLSFLYMGLLLGLVFLLKNFMKKKQVSTKVNRIVTFAACFVLAFALMGALVAAIMGLGMTDFFDDKPNSETYEFKGSTFHIYHDELPLTVEDLMEVDSDARYSYLANRQSSFLASKLDASQYPTMDNLEPPDLDYTFIEVKFSPLYDTFREELLTQYEDRNDYTDHQYFFTLIDPEPWGAQEAYQLCWGQDTMEEYLVFWEDSILEINFDWTPTQEQMTIVAKKMNP